MEKFNLKKAILENKATFLSSLNEDEKEYYKDAEADDAEHIDALEKDMKDDKKSSKMKMSELKAKIKEMALAEMDFNISDETPENEEDFLAEVEAILAEANTFEENNPERLKEFLLKLQDLYDEYHPNIYTLDQVYEGIQMITDAIRKQLGNLNEADEEVAVDDTEVAVDGEENIDVDTTVEVDPNVKAVQDALTQAQAAAQKLGDSKLTDQIGNTITFFTRAHVVEKGAVAEVEEMEEGKKSSKQKLIDAGYSESDAEDFADEFEQGGVKVPQKVKDILSVKPSMNESMFPMLKRILK